MFKVVRDSHYIAKRSTDSHEKENDNIGFSGDCSDSEFV